MGTPAAVVGAGMEGFDRPGGIANPLSGGSGSAYGGTPIGLVGAMNLAQIGGAQNTFGEAGDSIGLDFTVDAAIGQSGPQVIAAGSFVAPAASGAYTFHLDRALANVLNSIAPPPSPPDFWPVSAASVILASPNFSFTVGEVTCTPGDVNDDETVDGRDIQPFVTVFLDPGVALPQPFCAADLDEDDSLGLDDVTLFVTALVGAPVSCLRGDLNTDGAINGLDIQPFVTVVLDPESASPQQTCASDMNEDDIVNCADISPFVAALLGQPSCPAGDMNNDGAIDGLDIQGFVACVLGGGTNCPCGDFTSNGMVDLNDIQPFVDALVGP